MARKKKNADIDGQLCLNLNTDATNMVVQSNNLIMGRQNLSINAAKVLRTLIMQIKPDDDSLKYYYIDIRALSKMLELPPNDLYRDIDKITDELLDQRIEAKDPAKGKFTKARLVVTTSFDGADGLYLRINDDLRPFLLGLKERYTKYALEEILKMKSVYAIRIFELLQKNTLVKYLPKNGADIDLKVAEIRRACDCENKLLRFDNFKTKVLDVACKEINERTNYEISYTTIKVGRNIDTIRFRVNMFYH